MARRGWGRSIITAVLTSAGVAAAQLGVGYGLSIIAWTSTAEPATTRGAWTAGLVWTTWVGATSVLVGAITGDRASGPARGGAISRGMWRLVMAFAAALGALTTVPLVAVPARAVQFPGNWAGYMIAGTHAVIGVLAGLVMALIALTSRAVAANVLATAGWLWALAVIAVVDANATDRHIGYAQLGVWKFTNQGPVWAGFYIPGVLLLLGSALLIGGLAAFPSAGRGGRRIAIAVSGAMGPLLLAGAYALAAPHEGMVPFEQVSTYRAAPFMVVAGLAGSILVAVISRSPKRRTTSGAMAATGTASVPASSRVTSQERDEASGYGSQYQSGTPYTYRG